MGVDIIGVRVARSLIMPEWFLIATKDQIRNLEAAE